MKASEQPDASDSGQKLSSPLIKEVGSIAVDIANTMKPVAPGCSKKKKKREHGC